MPGKLDGIAPAHWLALHHPALPVVLCSGYMLETDRLQALRVEFHRALARPRPRGAHAVAGAILTSQSVLNLPIN